MYKDLLEKYNKAEDKIGFLRDNNRVMYEDSHWLIIENVKYHAPERQWYTAFSKTLEPCFRRLFSYFVKEGYNVLIKPKEKRTVDIFHVHIYKN